MIVCMPVVDGHDLTKVCIESLISTCGPVTKIVIFDNGSETPYDFAWIKSNFPEDYDRIYLHSTSQIGGPNKIISKENIGYYQPLKLMYDRFPEERLIGLIHNDMVMYEQHWDARMAAEFAHDPKLGLIGLCGSYELDGLGGRGGGTMCYFSGRSVQVGDRQILAQDQAAGLRINDLRPSLVLDSLFMMFHRDVIPKLVVNGERWEDITLAHFYDRIWPLRVIEAGMRVATMGIECDHLGGMTTTGNERYRDDCIKWLNDHGIPFDNPETEMYLVAERRFLTEYREQKKFMPASIGVDYEISHTIPRA